MKSHLVRVIPVFVVMAAFAIATAHAQQGTPARNFDAEIRAAVQSAKTAADFEFLGTLSRLCLLPQSGAENTSDNAPGYVTKPASAPARETWYADPARVFDNLYFVGGKVHSAWALTTSDGIVLIDTIFPYNSEELIVGGMQNAGSRHPKLSDLHRLAEAHCPEGCRRRRRNGDSLEPFGIRQCRQQEQNDRRAR